MSSAVFQVLGQIPFHSPIHVKNNKIIKNPHPKKGKEKSTDIHNNSW
jgi:hypothetical protein